MREREKERTNESGYVGELPRQRRADPRAYQYQEE